MPTVAEDPSELGEGESEMKIAWRYQSLPKVQVRGKQSARLILYSIIVFF